MSESTAASSGTTAQAKEKAQEQAERARQGLRGQIDQRSTQAGRQVSTQSQDIRSVADQLRQQGKDGPAKLADQAADRAERVGSWLERSDADEILHEVEDLARRNPWAVALGGLAVGFAASRVLKASSSDRYHGTSGGQAHLPAVGTTPRPTPVATTPGAPAATAPPVGGPSPTGL
jgi:gas vesicle protein